MTQRLILFRHAWRLSMSDSLRPEANEQISRRAEYFKALLENSSVHFMSSPKSRCKESIQPICRALGSDFELNSDLEERRPSEDFRSFVSRVHLSLAHCIESVKADFLFLCSHSDWLYEAILYLSDLRISLSEACWCILKKEKNEWILEDLVGTESEFLQVFNSQPKD